jgi:hypothetical protein
MSGRDYRAELVEDEGISPAAREMDVEREQDKLPPAKPEDVFRNIEAGLEEVGKALIDGNKIRAKVQFAGVKTLISLGNSIATTRNDAALKQKLAVYKTTLDELNEHFINGTLPQPRRPDVPTIYPPPAPTVPVASVKYCSQCGKKLEMEDKFCGQCGATQ